MNGQRRFNTVRRLRRIAACQAPHPYSRGDLPARRCPECGAVTLTTEETRRYDAARAERLRTPPRHPGDNSPLTP